MAVPPSLSRRRGTQRNSNNNNVSKISMMLSSSPSLRYILLFLLTLMTIFFLFVGGLFFQLTAAEKKTPVDSLRHKVQAIPNQLRGRQYKLGAVPFVRKFFQNKVTAAQEKNSSHSDSQPQQQHHHHHHLREGVVESQEEKQQQQQHHPPRPDNHPQHQLQQQQENGVNLKEYPYPLELVPETFDIAQQFKVLGGGRFAEYTSGDAPYIITDALRLQSDQVAKSRRLFVKRAMQFAWEGYEKVAFGNDEILPQSGQGSNGWGGMGVTLVDSLDTLWLMGLRDEFSRARDWVRDHLDYSKIHQQVSVFETTIRDLGGLLAAYDWSGEAVFLTKALDLGKRLIKAFDNTNTGIPFAQISPAFGNANNLNWSPGAALVAEFGTLQLENRYLSHVTGEPQFARKTEHAIEILREISRDDGLFPIFVRNSFSEQEAQQQPKLSDGNPKPQFTTTKVTFGAMGDSLYEYFLKVWLQGGKTEPMYREMYDKAIQSMHDKLLQFSNPSKLAYVADDVGGGQLDHKMDHLVCFLGGTLALGAYTDPLGLESPRAQRDLKTARALTYTCYQMYARMPTGISAEFVQFEGGQDFVIGRGAPHYLLRPEAVESFFYLSHLTGDPIYREWGWECFQAIEKYCKTSFAYGELSNVAVPEMKPRDKMESFFLAETLKYLYLLLDPDSEIDLLHKHVFNTEAHPLRIFPLLNNIKAAAATV